MTAILAALVLTLAVVGANGWLVYRSTAREILTPEPRRVVQNFVGALSARRPAIAHEHVAASAADTLSASALDAFASRLRARHGDFRFIDAAETRTGETAAVRTRLHTTRDGDIEVMIRLARDSATELWKVAGM